MTRMPITDFSTSTPQEFQIIDWFDTDYITSYTKEEMKTPKLDRENNKEYTIFAFGVNSAGNSICCRIKNFKPYFYIRIPDDYSKQQVDDMKSAFSTETCLEQGKLSYNDIEDE